ncbi:DUF2726 domain-containing protein, partial [Salmonella enterica]|nr:DUF2726 domain-containing protein [Salmonella enterica]
VFLTVFSLWAKSINKGNNNSKGKMSDNLVKKDNECYIKKDFLTNNERVFFRALIETVGDKSYVMAQVRLADIIRPNYKYKNNSKEYYSLFRQISQWHCDFLILDKETLEVLYIIELDDSSHKQEKRVKRDKFFNEALSQAGIKLLRVYNIEEFKSLMTKN